MKVLLSLVSVALASSVASALAEDSTQLGQLSTKGAEQLIRPTPDRSAPLPPEAAEVVRLSRAGVNERTLLNHVSASPGYSLTAQDVLTLHQKGVSLNVITAMLQRPVSADGTAPIPNPTPEPTMATVATTTGPNPPIIYPTPAREAVPLTDPVVVSYTGEYYYGGPSVLIVGSPYSYAAGYSRSFYGGPSYGGYYGGGFGRSYRSYGYGVSSYGYGYGSGYRASGCSYSSYGCASRSFGCSGPRCR